VAVGGVGPDLARERDAGGIEQEATVILHIDDERVYLGPVRYADEVGELPPQSSPSIHIKPAKRVRSRNADDPAHRRIDARRCRGARDGVRSRRCVLRRRVALVLAGERDRQECDCGEARDDQRAFSSALASDR